MIPGDSAGQPPPREDGGTKKRHTAPPTGNGTPVEPAKQPVEKGGLRGGPAPLLPFLLLASGVVAAAIGLLALLGWVLNLPLLASFKADYIPMAPSTAALFLLYGAAVCLRAREPLSRRAFQMSVAMAGLGTMVALLLFTLGGLNIHPAMELPGLDASATVQGMVIGHMSPVSALCFVFAGLSFLASFSGNESPLWRSALALGAAGLLLAASFVFLQAYLFGAPLLYGGTFIPPALNTILAFTVLGLALLALASRSAGLLGGSPASGPGVAFTFVLILALVAAGIATAGYRSYRNLERNAYSAAERQLAAIADLKVEELVQYRKERLGDANTFYKNSAFSERVRRFLEQPADADARRQLLAWLGGFQSSYEYNRIYLLDVQGVERLVAPDQPEPLPGRLATDIAACLQTGQIQFVDFYRDAPGRPIRLDILVPIFDSWDTNRPLGILGLRIDPNTYLYPLLFRWPVPGETSETLLVRREGDEAVLLSDLRFQTNTALIRHFPLTSTNILPVQAALGRTGIMEGKDYRGARVIGDARPIPDSPWFIVARENATEEFEPLRRQLSQLIFTFGVLLLGAATGVGLIWRQQRVRFYRRELEARAERARLGAIVESSDDAIIGKDLNGLVTSWNHGAEKIFGYTAGEMAGTSITRLIPADRQEEEIQILAKIARGESISRFETVRQTKDGRLMDVSITASPIKDAAGKVIGASKVARDITQLKETEREIKRLSRLYAALSQVNQAIVWTPQRDEMLEKICRALVENGGFRMAWIGRPDAETRRVKPVAKWGDSTDYLSQADIYADDRPEGRGPTGKAVREGKNYVCNDFARDPNTLPWHKLAERAGFRSSAGFPIRQDGAVCGALTIYSGEPGFFQDKEIALLEEACNDISFALDNLAREESRRQAEETVRRSQAEFKDLFDNAPVGFHEIDTQGRIVRINNTELKMLGYTAGELLGQFVWKISADEELSRRTALAKLGGGLLPPSEGFERVFRRKDGSIFPVLINDRLLEGEDGSITGIRTAIQDISERKRAEEKAAQNQERFKLIFESIPAGVALARQYPDGRFERIVNDAHLRICGLTREQDQIPGIYLKITHPEDAARQAELGRPLNDGSDGQLAMEKRYLRPDGTVVWVAFTFQRQHCADGSIEELTTVVDITERKQMEEMLRREQELFNCLIRTIPDYIYFKDRQSRFVRINDSMAEFFGLRDSAEAVGKTDFDFFTGEHAHQAYADEQQAMETGEPIIGLEEKETWPDGRVTWASTTKIPLRDAGGKVTGLVGISRDITERKRAEDLLRKSEAQLQEAQRIASMGSYSHDIASGHWSSSPVLDDLFGIDASYERSVAGWAALIHPDDRAMMVDHFEKEVLGEHRPFNKEYRIVRHNDQAQRWVHGLGKLEFDAAGRPEKMVGTIQDITGRRKLEEQFRQAQKMEGIGQLAGGVAHDFNNILAVIQMQADLLKTGTGITPAQLELASGIAKAAQRAANLTRQLLMFSRKQTLQSRDLDLSESINELTKMLRRTLGEDVQLQFKFAMQPLFIRADAGMLDQVLMNLAVNARDAMPKGGQLVIETSAVDFDESVRAKSPQARPGSFVCLSVSDTGSGIPPEILPHIFEPFFTTKEVGKGSGLGLATVHGIVQQHQGWINVYSEAGRGTTFRIYLPRLAGMSGQKPEPSDLAAVRGGNETILLVEDEEFLRKSAGKVLSQLGYRVLEAANGNEALEIWKQRRDEIKLLLTDLVMPGGMTGMDLGGRLLKENPELKVIYISGYSAEIAGKDFSLKEGVDFLTKPFAARKLAQTVRNSLDNI